VNRTLRKDGWRVVRVWQHELSKHNEARLVARLKRLGLIANETPTRYRQKSFKPKKKDHGGSI
jgi:G:T-mismatch repair DNA endonuclease (very short patch repair protein)